jgi:hypothetical protein
MITSKHTHGARKICPSHHFPVYTCTFKVGTVNIYKPFPEILCAFLGQPKNSVLSIFGQSCQPSWPFFFIFVIRITYQCLRKELAKTEHAINLPPPYRSVYMMQASMASSAVTERSNDNILFCVLSPISFIN